MSAIRIDWPRTEKTVQATSKGVFVATGRADETIVSASGERAPTAQPDQPFQLIKSAFYYAPDDTANKTYRWLLVFQWPQNQEEAEEEEPPPAAPGHPRLQPINCQLRVTGVTTSGEPTLPKTRNFKVQLPGFGIDVSWPSPHEDITDEAGNFTPYGDLSQYPLNSVTLTGSNSVQLLYSYGDYTDLMYWTAQFATVPPGTYTLTATDGGSDPAATATGLTVD